MTCRQGGEGAFNAFIYIMKGEKLFIRIFSRHFRNILLGQTLSRLHLCLFCAPHRPNDNVGMRLRVNAYTLECSLGPETLQRDSLQLTT